MCLMWLPHLPKCRTPARRGSAPASAVRHVDRLRRGHALVHKHAAMQIIAHRCIITSQPSRLPSIVHTPGTQRPGALSSTPSSTGRMRA